MTTIRNASITASLFVLMAMCGVATAGTSSASMRVGLTLTAPGAAEQASRVDGVVNADGAMGLRDGSRDTLRAAIAAAPRAERMLPAMQGDDSRVLAVQF